MIKRYIFLIVLLLPVLQAFSQMYILNEDFSGASGTTPPTGWTNEVISGNLNDKWHFDNPGEREINYPITDPFAIFDGDSTSANGEPEEVSLVTPLFDASTSNYILLHFVQTFDPGIGGSATIEASIGDGWFEIVTYSVATLNSSAEIVDLSAVTGGHPNARLRFTWSGNGSGFWALDNIRIYASLPVDGGVVSIDSPNSPVVPGLQNVEITLGNFGYNTLTSSKIDWTADGVPQPQFDWFGNIGFGQTASNIIIGSYDFQEPVTIKVWQSNPNGLPDLNPYNDTVSEYLVAALCGTYTIGGTDPDFVSFSQAAEVLNIAGVTCPVTFIVRDGIYYEQFVLKNIQGASAVNTITFRSESGDSTLATIKIIPGALKYESMIYLNGSRYVSFQDLGLATGSTSNTNNAVLLNGAQHINLTGCYFEVRNQSDFGLSIIGNSREIEAGQNRFESISARAGAINISGGQVREIEIRDNNIKGATEWTYATIQVENYSGKIIITDNLIDRCYNAIDLTHADSIRIIGNIISNSNFGVSVSDLCSDIEISANRFTNIKSHQVVQEGTSGIFMKNSSSADISNNFIHTTGEGPVMGISLENTTSCRVCFNSINITNQDIKGESNGILLTGSNTVFARNNVFRVLYIGTPIYIRDYSPQLNFDKNDYYCSDHTIGYYNGNRYMDLAAWVNDVGMDVNSFSVIPFYSTETDLSVNQALLNNVGVAVPGIDFDIDGVPRDPVNPDIGAKVYDPCPADAGINAVISPENPLNGGFEEVTVLLQNQGTNPLTSVNINWSVNDEIQTYFPWTGNLGEGENSAVILGDYDFQPGLLYILKVWTSGPDNGNDCNNHNDTISSQELAVPLCGDYTIGGSNPDFNTVKEAFTLLNLSGITCPVTFSIRDGIYFEKLVLKEIEGVSESNTVTFRSESGDSTLAVIRIDPSALMFESMIYLDRSQYINFDGLGFITGSDAGSSNNALLMAGAKHIEFRGCYFEPRKDNDLGITIKEGSQRVDIKYCRFECISPKAGAINITDDLTREINMEGNQIKGTTGWNYVTIKITNDVRNIKIIGNYIDRCCRAIQLISTDSVLIRANVISNTNDGIYIDDWCTQVEVSGNKLINILSHENAPEGTSGVFVDNASDIDLFNNFIHTDGDGPVIGINLQNASSCRVTYNSVNVTSDDLQGKSKGLNLKSGSGIMARNNIFSIVNSGTPVYISVTSPQIDIDYNDYYSLTPLIGFYNGSVYPDLTTWRAATNMDQHSFAVTPFYTSETDLSINQALLNNAGSPVSGITVDIDNVARNPVYPDMGAKEYDPCGNDAGINAVVSPSDIQGGGLAEVRVILQNQGTGAITSVKINWLVNDELQSLYSWSGNLAAVANTEVLLGEYNFQAGRSYVVKVWTSEPNNTSDCNPENDTISSPELAGPLCGTYTIGGTNPDFVNFAQAAGVLNSAGITCPVTFLIRDGIYFEKIILTAIAGTSAGNTITFRSESGDSSLAVIKLDPQALKDESTIYLDGTRHILFKNLGIFTGSNISNTNNAILMEGATDIELSGCYLEVRKPSDFGLLIKEGSQGIVVKNSKIEVIDYRAGAISISGSQTRNIEVSGNIIKGDSDNLGGILLNIGSGVRNVNVSGNNLERSYRSVFMAGADSIRVTGNLIKNSNEGIYVNNLCSNIEISQNRLINILSLAGAPEGTSGIIALNSTKIDIVNNFIQSAGIGPVLGINLVNTDTCRVYYNSVNITNNEAQGKSKGINLTTCNGVLARNNIFNIKTSGIPIFIGLNVTNLILDYNNYYHPSGIIGNVNDVVYTNLFEWGQTVNGDANSKNVNPYFKADTIPLPFQKILNGAGIPIAGFLFDIDGKVRHLQAPDIGCIEFFVDFGILELLSPTLNCFHPDVDSVIVYIRQFGDVPFDNLKVAYQLDNGTVHLDTIPGPLLYDIIHSFGTTENITAPGEYLFRIWFVGNSDDNRNNDTLIAPRYSKPPPVVTMDYDNFCTGWEVHFTGNATVEAPYYIDHYEWLFGDGETSEEQNPVHIYQGPGTYEVACRAYSDAGCYGELITSIYLDPGFQGLNLGYNLVNETCMGDSTGSLEFIATGGYPPYNYFMNGQAVTGNIISNLTSGIFEIRVVDSQDCSRTDTIESLPVVNMNPRIQADPLSGYTPLTVNFDFTADNAESWTWHFTEDVTDTNKSPSYTFTEYGHYLVILEVHSGPPYYCTDTASIEIFVDMIITIDANSVFTPNGDGYNDFFEVKSVGIKELDVNIFNQWGNRIYEITDVDGKWDGNTKGGAEAPDGTYFYALKAIGVNDQVYNRQGSVLLLRHGTAAFPNPVTDKVSIRVYDPLQSPVSISVFSVFGQLAHAEIIDDPDHIVLDLSHLSSGIYILQATDGSRNSFVRIIKN